MKPYKIMFIVTEDWYFVSHRLSLAIAAREAGHEVIVASRMTDHMKVISNAGIHAIPLRHMKRSSLNIFNEIAALNELFMLFRREKPDLLHLVALKPVIYGSLASQILGSSCRVNALGGLGFIFSSKRIIARLLRPIFMAVFRFIFNAPSSRLILQNVDDKNLIIDKSGVDQKNVRLIRSAGVDLRQYTDIALPHGTPLVILASRMLWDKGIGEFVEVASRLKNKGAIARFVLVGDPDEENPSSVSREQLQTWNDSGIVEWWGYQENMPQVLSQASIVCLPTFYGEGVPKILIEAMACARPIITTDMPGCRELVRDGRNGIIIQPNVSTDLADALLRLLDDPLLRQKMGREGRLIAEKEYSLPTVIRETLDIYQELLS